MDNLVYICSTMRVIAKSTLRNFWSKHTDVETQLKEWYTIVSKTEFQTPNDFVSYFGASCTIVTNNRVIFNIKGNNYRLIVKVNYEYQTIYIRFVGTHAEYDKINAETI